MGEFDISEGLTGNISGSQVGLSGLGDISRYANRKRVVTQNRNPNTHLHHIAFEVRTTRMTLPKSMTTWPLVLQGTCWTTPSCPRANGWREQVVGTYCSIQRCSLLKGNKKDRPLLSFYSHHNPFRSGHSGSCAPDGVIACHVGCTVRAVGWPQRKAYLSSQEMSVKSPQFVPW